MLEFIISVKGYVEGFTFDGSFGCLEFTVCVFFFFRELEFHSGTDLKENTSYVACLNRVKYKKPRKGCKCVSNLQTNQVDPWQHQCTSF